MVDLDNNFLSLVYSEKLAKQKEKIFTLQTDLTKEKTNLELLQKQFVVKYKHEIVRKYMKLRNKSGKFPYDDELTDVIFHLGGLEIKSKAPNIRIKLDNITNTFKVTYYNKHLSEWIKLEP